MPGLSAEDSFRRGLAALHGGDPATASDYFQSAVVIERQHQVARPQMRYLSYYGLSLALARGATPHAIQACEVASRRDWFNADLILNLGRVYLLAGKTTKALATLERGIQLAPDHRGLLTEYARADRRQEPPLSIVSRDHALNRWLGRLRWSLRSRPQKPAKISRAVDHP